VTLAKRKPAAVAAAASDSDSDDGAAAPAAGGASAWKKRAPGGAGGGGGGATATSVPAGGGAGGAAAGDSDDEGWKHEDSDSDSDDDEAFKGLTGRDRWLKRPGKGGAAKDGEGKERKEDDDDFVQKKSRKAQVRPTTPSVVSGKGEGGGEKGFVTSCPLCHAALLAMCTSQKRDVKGAEAAAAAAASSGPTLAAVAIDVSVLERKVTDASGILGRDWTKETLEARVQEELSSRGRRGIDPRSIAARLSALADLSIKFGPHTAIPTLMHAVSARLDLARGLDLFLDRSAWKRSARDMATILNMLEENPALRLASASRCHKDAANQSHFPTRPPPPQAPVVTEDLEAALSRRPEKPKADAAASGDAAATTGAAPAGTPAGAGAGSKSLAAAPVGSPSKHTAAAAAAPALAPAAAAKSSDAPDNTVRVIGDVAPLLERLFDDYIKALQHIDPHKAEYVVRITDEQALTLLVERAQAWYTRLIAASGAATRPVQVGRARWDPVINAFDGAARLTTLRLELAYYKHDSVAAGFRLSAVAADKRSEVAAIAAAAAVEALAAARVAALDAHRTTLAAAQAAAAAAAAAAASAPSGRGGAAPAAPVLSPAEQEARSAEAAAKAMAAAADPRTVGEAAAKLAQTAATQRGKRGYAAAAGVVATALVSVLASREGSLLSAGAVATARSIPDMELLADVEAVNALAAAEASGVDLGELSAAAAASVAGFTAATFNSRALLADQAAFVYRHGDARDKTRAILMHIYHHALHDRYSAAKDLLLMSKLQESIGHADVKVQILFNRAVAQMGLAAFRAGDWNESHNCLQDLCSSGHLRELLAQGLSQARLPAQDRDPDLEREERRRLVPHHMIINTELVDAVCMTSAMLLEVPNIAAAEHDPHRREISRSYRRMLDAIEGKYFVGPPETARDAIVQAGLALAEGEWRRAVDTVVGIKMWKLWTTRGWDRIKELLVAAMKEAGLVAYLHSFSALYDSVSLRTLAETFELPHRTVTALVSKLIYNGEIAGKLDQPTNSIVLHRAPPSRLQTLAIDFADRVADLAESNERALAVRSGADRFGGVAAGAGGDEEKRGGQYRKRHFDQRRMGSAVYSGRPGVFVGGGGRGGRGGYRGPGGYGSAKRDYRQRGY